MHSCSEPKGCVYDDPHAWSSQLLSLSAPYLLAVGGSYFFLFLACLVLGIALSVGQVRCMCLCKFVYAQTDLPLSFSSSLENSLEDYFHHITSPLETAQAINYNTKAGIEFFARCIGWFNAKPVGETCSDPRCR